jgi:hypothetical protein
MKREKAIEYFEEKGYLEGYEFIGNEENEEQYIIKFTLKRDRNFNNLTIIIDEKNQKIVLKKDYVVDENDLWVSKEREIVSVTFNDITPKESIIKKIENLVKEKYRITRDEMREIFGDNYKENIHAFYTGQPIRELFFEEDGGIYIVELYDNTHIGDGYYEIYNKKTIYRELNEQYIGYYIARVNEYKREITILEKVLEHPNYRLLSLYKK